MAPKNQLKELLEICEIVIAKTKYIEPTYERLGRETVISSYECKFEKYRIKLERGEYDTGLHTVKISMGFFDKIEIDAEYGRDESKFVSQVCSMFEKRLQNINEKTAQMQRYNRNFSSQQSYYKITNTSCREKTD